MEDDLILLSMKIKKDPLTYKEEYSNQLRILQSLLSLPTPPVKQIQPMIFFIVNHCLVDPERSLKILVDSLEMIQENKTKRVILNGLVLIRQKQLIESKELLRLIIKHGNDLNYFLEGVQGFIDEGCYEVLIEWYKKGTERQRGFSYYLMIVLYTKLTNSNSKGDVSYSNSSRGDLTAGNISTGADTTGNTSLTGKDFINDARERLEELICDGLFLSNKQCKTCCLYFLNKTEQEFDFKKLTRGEEYGKRLYKDLFEVMDRDLKIMKMKVFVQFKKHFGIRKSILGIVMKMIDLESEDLKEILDCLVESTSIEEALETVESVAKNFLDKGEEIGVLGLNVLRLIYSKFNHQDDCNELDSCKIDSGEYSCNSCNSEYSSEDGESDCNSDFELCSQCYSEDCRGCSDKCGDSEECESDCESEYDSNEEVDNINEQPICISNIDKIDEQHTASNVSNMDKHPTHKSTEIVKLKNRILELVKPFDGNRNKAIFYAYKNLIKTVVHNKFVERSVSHIKKKTLKEEKLIKRTKGREEMKRLRTESKREEKQKKYKNKRKGRKMTAMLKYMMKPNKKRTKK